ncbi:LysR substrate binding domain-containing protein [Priestia filamentosa]|nr:LysR substrate binding domain-containing protein [Priestia filamentosa]
MVVNQVEITKRFIKEGLGMSFLPFSVVEGEVKKGKIDAVPFSTFPLPASNLYVA